MPLRDLRALRGEPLRAETLLPVRRAQLLTYLKLTGHRLSLLINVNVPIIKEGIHRIAL